MSIGETHSGSMVVSAHSSSPESWLLGAGVIHHLLVAGSGRLLSENDVRRVPGHAPCGTRGCSRGPAVWKVMTVGTSWSSGSHSMRRRSSGTLS